MYVICTAQHTETDKIFLILKIGNEIIAKNIDKKFKKYAMSKKYQKPLNKYRHFKGCLYQSICIAKDYDENEDLVIYQNISQQQKDKYLKIYARPLNMFKSKVDKSKYPNINQEYRFEKI